MPQIVPSTGAYVGEVLGQVAEAVGNMLNPNKRFQDSVLAAISKDPSLIQKFADFEAGSPGILKDLGIPGLSGVQPTAEATFEAQNRDLIQKSKGLALGADMEKNKLTTKRVSDAINLLKTRPDISMDAAMQMVTGETSAQRTISQEEAKRAPGVTEAADLDLELRRKQQPAKLAEANLQAEGYRIAQQLMTEGPQVTLERFHNGEFNNGQLMGIFTTPFKDVLLMQQRDYLEKLQRDAMQRGDSDAMQRLQLAHAFENFQKAGSIGSVQGHLAYLYGGGSQFAAANIDKPEASLTAPEREQVAIFKALGANKLADESARRVALNARFVSALNEYHKIADSPSKSVGELQAAAYAVNAVLREANAPFSAEYGKKGTSFFSGSDLIFKDRTGKIVPISEVNKAITEPPSTDGITLSPAEQAEVDKYNALGSEGEKQAFIAQTRATLKDNPAALDKFERAIGVKK